MLCDTTCFDTNRLLWLLLHVHLSFMHADTYHPFTPPGNPEHVGELGYTYRDPYALTAAAQGASASASSSSSRSRTLLGKIGTNSVPDTVAGPNAGHKVGSPAARAALQRALKQWSGGDSNDYQWQLQFTALRRYQHSKKPANVFVLVKDMPGADPMPSAGKAIGAGGIDPDEVRARPDFCGSIEGRSTLGEKPSFEWAVQGFVGGAGLGLQTPLNPTPYDCCGPLTYTGMTATMPTHPRLWTSHI